MNLLGSLSSIVCRAEAVALEWLVNSSALPEFREVLKNQNIEEIKQLQL